MPGGVLRQATTSCCGPDQKDRAVLSECHMLPQKPSRPSVTDSTFTCRHHNATKALSVDMRFPAQQQLSSPNTTTTRPRNLQPTIHPTVNNNDNDPPTLSSPLFVPQSSPAPGPGDMDISMEDLTLEGARASGADSRVLEVPVAQGPAENVEPSVSGQSEHQDQDVFQTPPSRHGSPPLKRARLEGEDRGIASAGREIMSEQGVALQIGAAVVEQDASRLTTMPVESALEQVRAGQIQEQQLPDAMQQCDREEAELVFEQTQRENEQTEVSFEQQQQQQKAAGNMHDIDQGGDLPLENDYLQHNGNEKMDFEFDQIQQQGERLHSNSDPTENPEPHQDDEEQEQHHPSREASESPSLDYYPELEASSNPEQRSPPKAFSPFTPRAARPKPNPPPSNLTETSTAAATRHTSPTHINPVQNTTSSHRQSPPPPHPTPKTSLFTIGPPTPSKNPQAQAHQHLQPHDLVNKSLHHLDNLAHELYTAERIACEREESVLDLLRRAEGVRNEVVRRRRDGLMVLRERRGVSISLFPFVVLLLAGWMRVCADEF